MRKLERRLRRRVDLNEYKPEQAALGLKVTGCSFRHAARRIPPMGEKCIDQSSRRTPLRSGPNNDLLATHRGRDRATSAAVATAREIAFLALEKHLFWVNEPPQNADSFSAFAADIRGNFKK